MMTSGASTLVSFLAEGCPPVQDRTPATSTSSHACMHERTLPASHLWGWARSGSGVRLPRRRSGARADGPHGCEEAHSPSGQHREPDREDGEHSHGGQNTTGEYQNSTSMRPSSVRPVPSRGGSEKEGSQEPRHGRVSLLAHDPEVHDHHDEHDRHTTARGSHLVWLTVRFCSC